MLWKFLSRKFLSPFVFMLLSVLFKNFGFQIGDKELFVYGFLIGFYIFIEGLKDLKQSEIKSDK